MKKILATFLFVSWNSFATKPTPVKIHPLKLTPKVINTVDEKFLSFG